MTAKLPGWPNHVAYAVYDDDGNHIGVDTIRYERARANAAIARLRLAVGHIECIAIHEEGEPISGELVERAKIFLKLCGNLPND